MYSKPRLALKWFKYFLAASNGRGHGIHSPFVYKFIRQILMDGRSYDAYMKIEKFRRKLSADKREIQVTDWGAGSHGKNGLNKSVAEIANRSLSTRKFGRLLFRLSNYYQAGTIIELGSSLGISTAYLASGREKSRVLT